jgi:hypothetical protein
MRLRRHIKDGSGLQEKIIDGIEVIETQPGIRMLEAIGEIL